MIDIDYYYRFIDQRRLEKWGNKQTKKKYQSIVGPLLLLNYVGIIVYILC